MKAGSCSVIRVSPPQAKVEELERERRKSEDRKSALLANADLGEEEEEEENINRLVDKIEGDGNSATESTNELEMSDIVKTELESKDTAVDEEDDKVVMDTAMDIKLHIDEDDLGN